MKRTALVRRTPLRRVSIRRKRLGAIPSIDPAEALLVFQRDGGCVAAKYDPSHACFGRLTLAHVPELGKNALGMKPPDDRYHLLVECLGANSGGTQPWSETHRDVERAHLEKLYGPPPYPSDE